MVGMGYSREKINESLAKMKYDDITATYLLLGRRSAEVRGHDLTPASHEICSASDICKPQTFDVITRNMMPGQDV